MNPELQQLKDIHLPHAISMLPTSPGWLILLVLALGLICYLTYLAYQVRRRKKTVKYALTKLQILKDTSLDNSQNINIATEISILLRRTALYYFRRDDVAGLTGDNWLRFLNHSGNTNQFTDGAGRLLVDAPYRKDNVTDLTPLFALTQSWLSTIAKHKPVLAEYQHHV
jgi:hypothetical protein